MHTRLASLCLVVASMLPASALAQSGTLNRFRPSETNEDDFQLSRPTDFGDIRFGGQLTLDYGLNPLVWETRLGESDTEAYSVVEHQLTGTLGFAFGLADRVVIFTGLPIVFVNDGVDAARLQPGVMPADGAGLGDLYLGGRVRLFGEEEDVGAMALQVTGTFPTSIDSSYRGDSFLSIHAEVLGEVRPGLGSRIVANLGARFREETTSADHNLAFRHELTYALGFAIPFWTDEPDDRTHLDAHAQLYGTSAFALFGERDGTTVEWLAGVKLFHGTGIVAGLAMGSAMGTRGFGSVDYRLVVNAGWMMPTEEPIVDTDGDGLFDDVDQCIHDPEDFDAFEDDDGCPDPDNDQDGILDDPDQCPNEPETVNDFEDEDGCPDEVGDRDGDGLLDTVDECPDDPEDFDGFEDDDGCPEIDNDQDGLTDDADGCPNEPGPPENHGCPDTDRDGDTVVDRLDNCPDEPGAPENQGCPEEQQVRITERGLEILDRVYFRTNRATILRRSYALLLNVAQVLNAHPEIEHIRVEGHTDSRGSDRHNMELSQARAESVMQFLIERGEVDASRLEARGFGEERPVVENARTRVEHAQNRRVEFNIPEAQPAEGGAVEGATDAESEAPAEAADE